MAGNKESAHILFSINRETLETNLGVLENIGVHFSSETILWKFWGKESLVLHSCLRGIALTTEKEIKIPSGKDNLKNCYTFFNINLLRRLLHQKVMSCSKGTISTERVSRCSSSSSILPGMTPLTL